MKTRKIIAIAGGTGCGKTTAARFLTRILGKEKVTTISFDDYYRDQSAKPMEERVKTNYDHPEALEAELLTQHLLALKQGQPIERPSYDFSIHTRSQKTVRVEPREFVIVEGILALAYDNLRPVLDIKVFMDEPADVRFIRRLVRDVRDRGRTTEGVVEQYLKTVRPMHEQFVEPSKKWADYVIKGEANDEELMRVVKDLQ